MLLSRKAILKLLEEREIVINPFNESKLGVLSYNLSLGTQVVNPQTGEVTLLEDFQLLPNQFVLANTQEYLILSPKIAGMVMGRSSLARLGVLTTFDAHLIEPGFEGSLTLAIKNLSTKPVLLRPGLDLVHIVFLPVKGESDGLSLEDKKYQKEERPGESKLCREL